MAFFALVIGYLPVMYQSFSKREVVISLLDAAGATAPSLGARNAALLELRGQLFDRVWPLRSRCAF
jgi:hypothetical protein